MTTPATSATSAGEPDTGARPAALNPHRPRAPGRRLLALLVAAAVVLGAALWLIQRDTEPGPGPLYNRADDDFSFPVPTGRPIMYGVPVLHNAGEDPVTLVSATPAKTSPGLRVIDVLAAGAGRGNEFFAGDRRFPPRPNEIKGLRPVPGTVVPPDRTPAGREGVELVFGLQMDRPGRYVIDGIRVRYEVAGDVHEEVFVFRLAACAARGADATGGNCALPGDQ
jgi:hypothetical protein